MKVTWDRSKALIRFLSWVFFNLLIPFLPLALGFGIALLQSKQLPIRDIISETELFLLSLIVWSATKDDLDNAELDIKQSVLYYFLSRVFLPSMIIFSVFGFTTVYIQERISDIGLDKDITFNVAIIAAIWTTIVCLPIQLLISFVNTKTPAQQTGQQKP